MLVLIPNLLIALIAARTSSDIRRFCACDTPLAKEAKIAIVWKPPMNKLLKLPYLNSIICLGQGVDHILNNSEFKKNMSVYRIVDPYMTKSMSHWVILSVLNYIRNYDGYRYQQKKLVYKSIKIKDFQKVKIGVYGLGEIGNVVASDLSNLGFEVLGWSRTKKQNDLFHTFFDSSGFNHILKTVDIHVCLYGGRRARAGVPPSVAICIGLATRSETDHSERRAGALCDCVG